MPNALNNDYLIVNDLKDTQFDVSTGKVTVKIDPASPIVIASESAAGLKIDMTPAAKNALTASGIKPVSTVFNGTTGILTTTLSDGSTLTANVGIAAVDNFLSTATYDSATATLQLTMSNGSVKSVPLSDLVKVTTDGNVIKGDGTTANPVRFTLDPATSGISVGQSPAGLKLTVPTPVKAALGISADFNSLSILGSNSVFIQPYQGGTTDTTKVNITSPQRGVFVDVKVDPIAGNQLVSSAAGLKVLASASSATTNTIALSQAAGIVSTVNGTIATQAIPAGTIAQVLGFDATGKPVYSSPALSNNAVVQIGNPNISPPATIPTPVKGDIVVQTSDGTKAGQLQASYVWDGTSWVMQSAFTSPALSPATIATRTYYTGTTAWVDRFTVAETAATMAARGFAAVGPGTSLASSSLGNYYNTFVIGAGIPALNTSGANIAAIYNIPVSYIRHELAITPGVSNSYALKLRSDQYTNGQSVWVCNAAGTPIARLHGNAVSRNSAGDVGSTFGLGPTEENATWNRGWEWVQWLIPKALVDANKTATNTLKLAIAAATGTASGFCDIGGYAMSVVGNSSYVLTPPQVLDGQSNGGTAKLTISGTTTGNPYIAIMATSGTLALNSWPNPITTGGGFRVSIPDITKDIYLSVISFGNLYNYEVRSVQFGISHSTGNVPLGRPRPTQSGPLARATTEATGLAGMGTHGYLLPASLIAAKAITPVNSGVSYLEMYLENTDSGAAYIWGFSAETAN